MAVVKKLWFPVSIVLLCGVIVALIWKPWESAREPLPLLGAAADFELERTDGSTVSLADTAGKARLIYFFFSYCPDVCLPTTAILGKLQDELKSKGIFGDEAVIMSVTFDPERDTAERLIQYSDAYGADSAGWWFLRGDEDYIRELAKSYKISVLKDPEGNFIHQNYYVLVDGNGELRQWYNMGVPEEITQEKVEQIADDMESLIR